MKDEFRSKKIQNEINQFAKCTKKKDEKKVNKTTCFNSFICCQCLLPHPPTHPLTSPSSFATPVSWPLMPHPASLCPLTGFLYIYQWYESFRLWLLPWLRPLAPLYERPVDYFIIQIRTVKTKPSKQKKIHNNRKWQKNKKKIDNYPIIIHW